VKLSKIIFLITFIAVSLVCTKANAVGNFTKVLRCTPVASHNLSSQQDKKTSLNQAISIESFFLKTSTQSSATSRIEERDFLGALFLSFFSFARTRKTFGNLINKFQLLFVPHALKIIFPYHHFW
jgi:hypothetical protein